MQSYVSLSSPGGGTSWPSDHIMFGRVHQVVTLGVNFLDIIAGLFELVIINTAVTQFLLLILCSIWLSIPS